MHKTRDFYRKTTLFMGVLLFSYINASFAPAFYKFHLEITSNNTTEGYVIGFSPFNEEAHSTSTSAFVDTFSRFIKTADVFIFEGDLDSIQVIDQMAFVEHKFYEDVDLLEQQLSPQTFRQLSNRMEELDRPQNASLVTSENIIFYGGKISKIHWSYPFQMARELGIKIIKLASVQRQHENFINLPEET